MVTDWVLIATGFTGAWTLRFFWKMLEQWFVTPPVAAVHFSPKGGCTEAIVAELQRARREILVQAYSFTSRAISEELIAAHRRGVRVEVILDHSNEKEAYTDLPHLLEHGLQPLIDSHHAIAHNKIMLIDGRTILTGSFNFTHQAEQENAENLLILKGQPALVRRYRENFEEHRGHARAASPSALPAQGQHRRAA